MLTEMSLFDTRVLISCVQKSFVIDKTKSKERACARWIKSSSVSACSELLEEAVLISNKPFYQMGSADFV